MNSSRGTRSIAASTRSSTMSRARSWSSTMRSRSAERSFSAATLDAEMVEHTRCNVDDPRGRGSQADGEHRHLRVAQLEGAVRATTDVVAAAEVYELDPGGGRDDEVARVRVLER